MRAIAAASPVSKASVSTGSTSPCALTRVALRASVIASRSPTRRLAGKVVGNAHPGDPRDSATENRPLSDGDHWSASDSKGELGRSTPDLTASTRTMA